ncbi:MAG: DnaJ family domain-containing protein [Desulfovibrionaceae bacterium]
MFGVLHELAEERIRKAQEDGAFEGLPGAGRPLEREDDSHVPPELRMAFKILKNSGYVPAEVAERRELLGLLDLLDAATDEGERYRCLRRAECLLARFQSRQGRDLRLEQGDEYQRMVIERIGRARGNGPTTSS